MNASTKVYGAANPAFTDTFAGLVNGDTLTSTYTTKATAASPVASYPVTLALSGSLLPNYTPTITNGTLTVTKAPLTVVVASASRVYGAANPTLTGTITGQENGDTITAAYSTTATATSAVGKYPITAALSGSALSNYTPTITNGTLTVTAPGMTAVLRDCCSLLDAPHQSLKATIVGRSSGLCLDYC